MRISITRSHCAAAIPSRPHKGGANLQATFSIETETAAPAKIILSYRDIASKTSVAGDGSTRSLRLESHTSTPELSVRIVPSVDPTGYLEAHLVNKTNGPLLPGNVNLFRDGAFSGKTAIPAVAASDSYNLGFGADNSVKVTREPISLLKSNAAWNKWSTSDVSDIKTTVKNLHSIPIAIVVNDRIPVPRNDDIKVDLLSETTPLSTKDLDGKVGVYAWNFNLAPGASKDVRLAYKMSWPPGKNISLPR